MRKVAGVGINDADYQVQNMATVNGKVVRLSTCPYYYRWSSILNRCYRKGGSSRFYEDVEMCDEWKTFMNFRRWMEVREWKELALDKDCLSILTGVKEYSPDNCAFIHKKLNTFLMHRFRVRGDLPLGVCRTSDGTRYRSTISTGKWRQLGIYTTPEKAHSKYQYAKWEYGVYLLDTLEHSDKRIGGAFEKILQKLKDEYDQGKETTKLV